MDHLKIAARVSAQNIESKIRNTKDSKFNLDEFKRLSSPEEMLNYTEDRLEKLGAGSSRTVFALSGSKVLKIAAPLRGKGTAEAGIAQNKSEVDIYTNPNIKEVVAKIFDSDSEYRWIISEIVRPLNSRSEFESLTNTPLTETVDYASAVFNDQIPYELVLNDWKDEIDMKPGGWFDIMLHLLDMDLIPGDLDEYGHWGKTSEGRVVLLDYGFTGDVGDNFYQHPEEENPDEGTSDGLEDAPY